MNADPIYQQHSILFIDDEVQSQKYFSQIFGKIFKVHLASDGEKGLALFREHRHEIGVVVSDQRMPGMAGSELLAEIAKENADVVKILSTAYSDLEAAIDAVNEGGIYRYVTKPWDLAELEVTLRRAMDFFQLKEQHRSLARMKIAGLEQMFHQSRLLACIAIPRLDREEPLSRKSLPRCAPTLARPRRPLSAIEVFAHRITHPQGPPEARRASADAAGKDFWKSQINSVPLAAKISKISRNSSTKRPRTVNALRLSRPCFSSFKVRVKTLI